MIHKSLYKELENITGSIKIISDTSYTFQGQLYMSQQIGTGQSKTELPSPQKSLTLTLADMLYWFFHCRRTSFPKSWNLDDDHYNDVQDFVGTLSEANTGNGTWDPGWEVLKVVNDRRITVYKDGLKLWISPQQFGALKDNKMDNIQVGKKGFVRMPKEFRELLPGFYVAIGNESEIDEKNTTIVRLYWNITAKYATSLMKRLTTELNTMHIPFRFKILKDPYSYPRADAAVLYVDKRHLEPLKKSLSQIYAQVMIFLNHPTPLFAKRLVPGLALAEEPDNKTNNNESFGQHRCRILAEALFSSYKNKIASQEESISEIIYFFKSLSVDLERPYLNSNSTEDYDMLFEGGFNKTA
jgi:hypothetical protein